MRARLRRNSLHLLYLITAVWLVKLFIHPITPHSPSDLFQRMVVGGLFQPWFVVVTAIVFVAGTTYLALSCPPAEELDRWLPERARSSWSPNNKRQPRPITSSLEPNVAGTVDASSLE